MVVAVLDALPHGHTGEVPDTSATGVEKRVLKKTRAFVNAHGVVEGGGRQRKTYLTAQQDSLQSDVVRAVEDAVNVLHCLGMERLGRHSEIAGRVERSRERHRAESCGPGKEFTNRVSVATREKALGRDS